MFTFWIVNTRDHSVLDRGGDYTVAPALLEFTELDRMRAFAQLKRIKISNVLRQSELRPAKLQCSFICELNCFRFFSHLGFPSFSPLRLIRQSAGPDGAKN